MRQSIAPSGWQRWIRQPQTVWLRRALFQVHLWTGIAFGLYLLLISITGSVVVYRNELYVMATAKPIISTASAPRLTDRQLTAAAQQLYPGYRVADLERARNLDEAVRIWLRDGKREKERLFDPRTGNDLGQAVPRGVSAVSWLLDLHDNLLAGPTGREVNGIGAVAVLVLAATGLVIWWPGIKTWRRSLTMHRGVGWRRLAWDLHSMIGFWSLAFILLFAVSGVYLCFPEYFENLAIPVERFVPWIDQFIYWLSILHTGRINGIGFACGGRTGLCDQTIKATYGGASTQSGTVLAIHP